MLPDAVEFVVHSFWKSRPDSGNLYENGKYKHPGAFQCTSAGQHYPELLKIAVSFKVA
jgi:hypothetical protein